MDLVLPSSDVGHRRVHRVVGLLNLKMDGQSASAFNGRGPFGDAERPPAIGHGTGSGYLATMFPDARYVGNSGRKGRAGVRVGEGKFKSASDRLAAFNPDTRAEGRFTTGFGELSIAFDPTRPPHQQRGLRFDNSDVRGNQIDDAAAKLLDGLRRLRVLRMHGAATEQRGDAVKIGVQSDTQGVPKCPRPFDNSITEGNHS